MVVVDTRMMIIALGLALAASSLWLIRDVLLTFVLAGILAFLGAPAVARLERFMSRPLGAAVFIAGAALGVLLTLAVIVPPLVEDLVDAFRTLPALMERAASWLEATFHVRVPRRLADLSNEAAGDLAAQLLPLVEGSGGIVKKGAAGVVQGALGAAGLLAQAFLVPVLAFFTLAELPGMQAVLRLLVPRAFAPLVQHYVPRVHGTLSRLVRGQATVAVIMAIMYAIGLASAGVPFALTIAVVSGAAYLVPFASGAVCLLLAAAFTLLHAEAPAVPAMVGAVVTVVVVQLAESYVLTPRIVGAEAGLSPLATLVAVIVGGAAGSFLGVFLALPAAAVVALVLHEEARRPGGLLRAEPEARS